MRVLGSLLLLIVFLTACGKKAARVNTPPPPSPSATSQLPSESSTRKAHPSSPKAKTTPPAGSQNQDQSENQGDNQSEDPSLDIPPDTVPVFTTTGMASWYGPPYHNHRASNGEIFDMNAMTAASLTLPLGTIVRVTNVKTSDSTLVRINDRGPFVEGRILDLSMAAAKKIGVWRAGVAQIKLEVLKTPSPLDTGGRWCVQIGSLQDEDSAARLQDHLQRRYHSAQVIKFLSPVGVWWVRVRVAQDDRSRAEELARETQTDEGTVFLVRLD